MTLINELHAILGAGGLRLPGEVSDRYLHEPRGRFISRPLAVARPADTDQVASVVGLCRKSGVAIVPQGGNTGLVGGASAPGQGRELILSLERMRTIRRVDTEGAFVLAEAGCTLAAIQDAAFSAGMYFPLSLASEGTATIGGNVATNAGGNLTLRYGNARSRVLGLEVVLAEGQVFHGLSELRKDNSGYDLKQLFIGSEGTLGIVTAASLEMVPAPVQRATALAGIDSVAGAVGLLTFLRRKLGETLSSFELISRNALEYVLDYLDNARDPLGRPWPWYVLLQSDSALVGDWLEPAVFDALDSAMADRHAGEVVVAGNRTQAAALWRLRETISAAQSTGGASIKHDIAVPVGRIPGFLDQAGKALAWLVPGVRPCVFGHLGDGNLHFNLSQPAGMTAEDFMELEAECNQVVFDLVERLGGSIAAEHGIGQLRRAELAHRADPVKLQLMGRIKRSLDPESLLNPGKVLSTDAKSGKNSCV